MADRIIDFHAHALGHAIDHYDRLGYRVLARVARTRFGAIDLVFYDESNRVLVFASVTSRRADAPAATAHVADDGTQRRQAVAWLAATPSRPAARELRFDALAVVLDGQGRLVDLTHAR